MNGRVYDPELGRFLSPDPFVQFPDSTQGYNRYAYVANNPLSYNDPSGHFLQFIIAANMMAAGGVTAAGGALMMAGSIASAVQGYASGGLNGLFKSVVAGGVTVGITYGMATGLSAGWTNPAGITTPSNLGPIATAGLMGLGGGIASKAGGGRFGDGFLGGASGSLTNSYLPESWKDGVHGIIVQTIVGGTVSSLGGGKFGNGAISAFVVALVANGASNADKPGVPTGICDCIRTQSDLRDNITVSVDGRVTVRLTASWNSSALSETEVDRFISDIETGWSGTFKNKDGTDAVTVDVKITKVGGHGAVATSATSLGDIDFQNCASACPKGAFGLHTPGASHTIALWKSKPMFNLSGDLMRPGSTPTTAAHEIAHMFGFGHASGETSLMTYGSNRAGVTYQEASMLRGAYR